VIAAISVSWPMFRYNEEDEKRNASAILEASKTLSALFGYTEGA